MTQIKHSNYNGYEVTVDDFGIWHAKDEEQQISADTLEELRKKIDRLGVVRRTSRKIKLSVVSTEGNKYVVTGINLTTYNLAGLKKEGRFGSIPEVYVDHPHVLSLIEEGKQIEAKLAEVQVELSHYRIAGNYRYSRGINQLDDPASYERALADIEAEYARALKLAEDAA